MEKNKIKYVLAALVIVVCGMMWYRDNTDHVGQEDAAHIFEPASQAEPTPDGSTEQSKIYVHITGAVKKPGVYTFETTPRVVEVVEKAGGFTKDAVKSGVNQAETVEDGAQIVIASKRDKKKKTSQTDAAEGEAADEGTQGKSELLNINTATKEELMTLTGIGESKALSIISYRQTKGKFEKIEDIMNITGIKDGIFDKIKDRIKV